MQPVTKAQQYESLVKIHKELNQFLTKVNPITSFTDRVEQQAVNQNHLMPPVPSSKALKNLSATISPLSTNDNTSPIKSPNSIINEKVDKYLDRVIHISEKNQPSETELSDRIMGNRKQPLSVFFDVDSNRFEVDVTLVPKNGLLQFKPRTEIYCRTVNEKEIKTIRIKDTVQILSSHTPNQGFGYVYGQLDLLMIPLDKLVTDYARYPPSRARGYLFDWNCIKKLKNDEILPDLSETSFIEMDSVSDISEC